MNKSLLICLIASPMIANIALKYVEQQYGLIEPKTGLFRYFASDDFIINNIRRECFYFKKSSPIYFYIPERAFILLFNAAFFFELRNTPQENLNSSSEIYKAILDVEKLDKASSSDKCQLSMLDIAQIVKIAIGDKCSMLVNISNIINPHLIKKAPNNLVQCKTKVENIIRNIEKKSQSFLKGELGDISLVYDTLKLLFLKLARLMIEDKGFEEFEFRFSLVYFQLIVMVEESKATETDLNNTITDIKSYITEISKKLPEENNQQIIDRLNGLIKYSTAEGDQSREDARKQIRWKAVGNLSQFCPLKEMLLV